MAADYEISDPADWDSHMSDNRNSDGQPRQSMSAAERRDAEMQAGRRAVAQHAALEQARARMQADTDAAGLMITTANVIPFQPVAAEPDRRAPERIEPTAPLEDRRQNDGSYGPVPLKPDAQAAQSFLEWLGGDVVLCTRAPDAGGMNGLRGNGALEQALARNISGENIYFALNIVGQGVVKKPANREIETIHAVCGDIDWDRKRFKGQFEAGLAEINIKLETLKALALPPSRIIHSGGGLQPIWRIEPLGHTADIARRVRAVGKAIRRRFGGDAVHDLSRILRLPTQSIARRKTSATPGNCSLSPK
jgi:hypothetical protein